MFTPAVIGLMLSSAVVALLAMVASIAGVSVSIGWNPDDSSARQLRRERRSFLVESIVGAILGIQLLIFFLFLATADRIHELLSGAMCAAGSLAASRFGYPLLLVHVIGFVLAATWLILNRATRTAVEPALVRFKHGSLLVVAAVLSTGAVLQGAYFRDLDPSILTSCCATIFAPGAAGVAATFAALPPAPFRAAFFATLAATLVAGGGAMRRGRVSAWFPATGLALGALAVCGLVVWIGPDFYRISTHHCPFCVLAGDHHYVGYPLYALLASGVVTALASGGLGIARRLDSSLIHLPGRERDLCRASLVSWVLFAIVASAPAIVD